MNKVAEEVKARMIVKHGEAIFNKAFEAIEYFGGEGAFEWIVTKIESVTDGDAAAFAYACVFILRFYREEVQGKSKETELKTNILWN